MLSLRTDLPEDRIQVSFSSVIFVFFCFFIYSFLFSHVYSIIADIHRIKAKLNSRRWEIMRQARWPARVRLSSSIEIFNRRIPKYKNTIAKDYNCTQTCVRLSFIIQWTSFEFSHLTLCAVPPLSLKGRG